MTKDKGVRYEGIRYTGMFGPCKLRAELGGDGLGRRRVLLLTTCIVLNKCTLRTLLAGVIGADC